MTGPQLCLCGTQAGYPHAFDCPRPLFRATAAQEDGWMAERAALREQITDDYVAEKVARERET